MDLNHTYVASPSYSAPETSRHQTSQAALNENLDMHTSISLPPHLPTFNSSNVHRDHAYIASTSETAFHTSRLPTSNSASKANSEIFNTQHRLPNLHKTNIVNHTYAAYSPHVNTSTNSHCTNNKENTDKQSPESHITQNMSRVNGQDPLNWPGQCAQYENAIRSSVSTHCHSCHRFLFHNQIFHIAKPNNNITRALQMDKKSPLCSTCHRSVLKGQIPSTSVAQTPDILRTLNKIERRLLALIQVFMTMIILPGGQYAEKGLVLNIPVNVTQVTSQLPQVQHDSTCFVSFEDSQTDAQYIINPCKVWEAFNWLKHNNHLYEQIQNNTKFLDDLSQAPPPENSDNTVSLNDLEENALIPVNYSDPLAKLNSSCDYPTLSIIHSDAAPVSIYAIPYGEEKVFPLVISTWYIWLHLP